MKIGEVVDIVGIDAPTIRFYESEGVIPAPHRNENGYREYCAGDIKGLQFVATARSLGLPLEDIREILSFRDRGEAPCNYVRSVIDRQAGAIEQRIVDLQQMATELRRLQRVARTLPAAAEDDPRVCHIFDDTVGEVGR